MNNLTIGQTVYNTRFGVHYTGTIIDGDKVQVIKDGRTLTPKLSDLWQPLPIESVENAEPIQPISVLEAILDNPHPVITDEILDCPHNPVLSALIDSIPEFSEVDKKDFVDLKHKYKDLDKKENYAVKVIPFEKGKILNAFRDRKLYKLQDNGKYKTFEEFVTSEFGITREYACNLAAIGAFLMVAGEFDKAEVSVNSAKAFVINQNALATQFGLSDKPLQDFKPYLDEVLNVTIETAQAETGKDKPVITPNIVNAVNAEIREVLDNSLDRDDLNLIEKAAAKLATYKPDLVALSQKRLNPDKAEKKEKCPHSVDIQEVTESHVILTCGCKFNLEK